jgi:hypothetical protein
MTSSHGNWKPRSPERLPDGEWHVTVNRVRGEFHEMPGMRLSPEQAQTLLGLKTPVSTWVFDKLESEGFLARTPQGEYTRRHDLP